MRRRILGTAGHIDHGKTALVRALTGVDTDRLAEEKERGITIDLGFAALDLPGDVRLGVVDVPGHEGFIRNMVAGATGVDTVLLVVAADEGVMPQTREHLAIVDLLDVERMVVALTKADLVEEAWLDLVREEVREALGDTRFADAPLVATSVEDGRGLDALRDALARAVAGEEEEEGTRTLARLPLDRIFTVRGTGTVVTGTLRHGRLALDDRVRILPAGLDARVRGLQVHGDDVDEARPGERTAVALSGSGVEKRALSRGETLLVHPTWPATSMLTTRVRVLPGPGWPIEQGQRVRVHLGTAEVMARCAVLDGETVPPGHAGWIQLRLERPLVARARDSLVVRSYSPMTTLGGGRVAEPLPPKRTSLTEDETADLEAILDGGPEPARRAVLRLAGWSGVEPSLLPILTGRPHPGVGGDETVSSPVASSGGAPDRLLDPDLLDQGRERLLEAIDTYHESEPIRPGIPLERLRAVLPARAPERTAGALLGVLEAEGVIRIEENVAARRDFRVSLSREQEAARENLRTVYREAGLSPPAVEDLPEPLAKRTDLWPLLKLMERDGELRTVEEGLLAWGEALREAERKVVAELGGRSGLGPADFRPVLELTRKHLIPLLGHLDRMGVTVRGEGGRDVVDSSADP